MAKKSGTNIIILVVIAGALYYAHSKKLTPFNVGGLFDQLKAKISGTAVPTAPSLTSIVPPALPSTIAKPMMYCLDSSAIDTVTGLCANGTKPITQNLQQAAVSQQYCQDGSIPNATSGICQNGAMPITYFCTDGSTMNVATSLCANGLKPIPTVVPAAVATPTGGDIQAGVTPGTGPAISSDQSIQNTFLKGLYEQIFNPYSSAQALGLSQLTPGSIGSTFACADGSTADPITNICANGAPPTPTISGYNQLPTTGSPGYNLGTRSPIVGGDVPAGTPSAQTIAQYQTLASQYGLTPPGGSLTGVDANALFPNFDTGAGSITGLTDNLTPPVPTVTGPILSTTCFTDSTGQTWCVATQPDATCNTIAGQHYCPQGGGCITLSGQQYCPSGSSTGPGCIVVGSQLYCPKLAPTTPAPSTACPPGYTYDNAHGLCTQNTQSAPPVTPTCPTGYTYDAANQVCVQNAPAPAGGCPTGTRFSACYQACLPAGINEPAPGSPQCIGYVAPTPSTNNTTVTPAPPVTVPTDTGLLSQCLVQSGIQYCPCNSLQPGSIVQNGQVYCSQQAAIPPAPVTTPPAGTPVTIPSAPCIQTQLCTTTAHWDPVQCKCAACPAGTFWNTVNLDCEPGIIAAPPPPPGCPSGYGMSSGGHCVNCSSSGSNCCNSAHAGNCHVECGFTGHDDGTTRCAQCLSVCGSYAGECNCSSHSPK